MLVTNLSSVTEKQVKVQAGWANNIMICICMASLFNPAPLFLFVMCPDYIATIILNHIKDIQKGSGFQMVVYMKYTLCKRLLELSK